MNRGSDAPIHVAPARNRGRAAETEKEGEEEESESRVESAVAGCVFPPSPDPQPPSQRCPPTAHRFNHPTSLRRVAAAPPRRPSPSCNRESSGRGDPLLAPLALIPVPPLDSSSLALPRLAPRPPLARRATTRGEVLALPTSTRGVPTTLSRIYHAQFSCSRDVSSPQFVVVSFPPPSPRPSPGVAVLFRRVPPFIRFVVRFSRVADRPASPEFLQCSTVFHGYGAVPPVPVSPSAVQGPV